MTNYIPLIVPGLYGSELHHWQTWLERKLPKAIRVEQPDWDNPMLTQWTATIMRYLDHYPGKFYLIAHSFGCLASVAAAVQRPERIAGAMLVAMADPQGFNTQGFRLGQPYIAATGSIASHLPKKPLGFPSVVVASTNDPWMSLENAQLWAERWESHLINLGDAGHINVASGYGPWPQGLEIFAHLQQAQFDLPQGTIS